MDPFTASLLIGTALGGANLIGGQMTNAANAQQANQANQLGIMSQLEGQQYQSLAVGEQERFNTAATQQAQQFALGAQNTQIGAEQGFMNQAMAYNTAQAQVQRDYESTMSSTAYQRAVGDMKAAGLNPILSAGTGGASTPSVASPTISAPSVSSPTVGAAQGPSLPSPGSFSAHQATFQNPVGPAISSALQGSKLYGELNLQKAQAMNLTASASASNASAGLDNQRSITEGYNAANTAAQKANIISTNEQIQQNIRESQKRISDLEDQIQKRGGEVSVSGPLGLGFRYNKNTPVIPTNYSPSYDPGRSPPNPSQPVVMSPADIRRQFGVMPIRGDFNGMQ